MPTVIVYSIVIVVISIGSAFLVLALLHRHNKATVKKLEQINLEVLKQKANIEQKLKGYEQGSIPFPATSSGGYIILDLPDRLKGMFSDILKGFEEYAKLKGYEISFSVDTSISEMLAFKFNFQDHEVEVDTQTVRSHIREYIEKVKNGDHFDDLPVVISRQEHELVSTTLKNRINFLQHNYNLEKNSREYYENLMRQVTQSPLGFMATPTVFIQTGGVHQPKQVWANQSANVLQGEETFLENNVNQSLVSTVTISNSYNKRKEQVSQLEEVIKLIREEKGVPQGVMDRVVTSFDKVKEEIAEEEQPDAKKIYKWLHATKKLLENIVLAHHTKEAIHWLYESFHFLTK